jgi:hypothetical protein
VLLARVSRVAIAGGLKEVAASIKGANWSFLQAKDKSQLRIIGPALIGGLKKKEKNSGMQ